MKVRRQSYGQKILNSFAAAILGVIMFLASFAVLFWNEGRENLAKAAGLAEDITDSASLDGVKEGKAVCVRGSLDATGYAADEYLVSGDYIYIERTVEMYAYVEKVKTTEKDNFGGSSTIIEEYSYELVWTDSPQKTDTFKGDVNEQPFFFDKTWYNNRIDTKPENKRVKASGLKIGPFSVDNDPEMSGAKRLELNQGNTKILTLEQAALYADYIYMGQNPASPQPGDIRISYKALRSSDKGILFGEAEEGKITKYKTKKGNELFRYFADANSKNQAVDILDKEHRVISWILRIVGFLLMFIGLMAMSGPITKFLSVIPVFAKISNFVFGIAAFIISLVLTALTIALSILLHNFLWAMLIVAAIIAITITAAALKRKKATQMAKAKR